MKYQQRFSYRISKTSDCGICDKAADTTESDFPSANAPIEGLFGESFFKRDDSKVKFYTGLLRTFKNSKDNLKPRDFQVN